MKITSKVLRELKACTDGRGAFRRVFGSKAATKGVEITPAVVEQFCTSGESSTAFINWLLTHVHPQVDTSEALRDVIDIVTSNQSQRLQVEMADRWEMQRQLQKKLEDVQANYFALFEEGKQKIDAQYVHNVAMISQRLDSQETNRRAAKLELGNSLHSFDRESENLTRALKDKLHKEIYESDYYKQLNEENKALEIEMQVVRDRIRHEVFQPYYEFVSDTLNWLFEQRAEHQDKFTRADVDWNLAPAWANYHAFDIGGQVGHWYKNKPDSYDYMWLAVGSNCLSNYSMPLGMNWRETLRERPAVVVK